MTLMPVSNISAAVDWSVNVGGPVDRPELGGGVGAELVHRVADDVEDAAEHLLADGHRDGRAGVLDVLPAAEAVGRVHRDGPHHVAAEVGGHFEHQVVGTIVDSGVRQLERVEDVGDAPGGKLHVDDGSHHLGDLAHVQFGHRKAPDSCGTGPGQSAEAPDTISMSSLVMAA
jgi:hypothetical protein